MMLCEICGAELHFKMADETKNDGASIYLGCIGLCTTWFNNCKFMNVLFRGGKKNQI